MSPRADTETAPFLTRATQRLLPPEETMLRAVRKRDATFEGIFIFGVRTTGVFCRPGCPARAPKPENVAYFADARAALEAGYRACRRCHPLERTGRTPDWLRSLLEEVEAAPEQRFTDADLRERGLTPERVRRWFLREHGMTFHAYQRSRRLGLALDRLEDGADILETGLDHGFDSASGFAEAVSRVTGVAPGRARKEAHLVVRRLSTPLGTMVAAADDRSVHLLDFADPERIESQLRRLAQLSGLPYVPGRNDTIDQLTDELDEYFDGERTRFEVPLTLHGTPFQRKVWTALRRIRPGKVRAYGELADAVGRPGAVRAVGRANGDNRCAILVPCHRVVGADGTLTGYGGGLWRKRWLLEHEGWSGPTPPVR